MEDPLAQQHHQHQHDSEAAAVAAAAAAVQLGLGELQPTHQQHHFHHNLQQPDFSHTKDDGTPHSEVEVHGLEIPVEGEPEIDVNIPTQDTDLELSLGIGSPHVESPVPRTSYGRPPSIRKACDLCHAAKQKCSGDRPSCTRCQQGGWQCVYAPRQRRRTVPKDQKLANMDRGHLSMSLSKKRKLNRDLGSLGPDTMDMRVAMGMAMDLGLAAEEEEDEHLLTMSDEQMLECIAIDGYLADLPLATFVHNLPYNQPPPSTTNFTADDFGGAGDGNYSSEMDQHTTSALRDAIFSLNESAPPAQPDGGHADVTDGTGDQQGLDGIDQQGLDPHLALLDLSHAMPVEDGNPPGADGTGDLGLNNLGAAAYQAPCQHVALVPRILALLTQHPLEPKPGSNTPLSMYIFTPLSRSLRLFHALTQCPHCSGSPQQTLPQLALLSRTTTILTFPCPPPPPNAAGQPSAQLVVHNARLSGTGISEAIETHIVGVVWDSWRASIREIFNAFERKAKEVIQANAAAAADGQEPPTSAETQRAGLMFQAMSRLVSAMNEVERD